MDTRNQGAFHALCATGTGPGRCHGLYVCFHVPRAAW